MNQPMGSQSRNRRAFLAYFSGIGLSAALLPEVLWARLHERKAGRLTVEDVGQAAKAAGLELSEEERKEMVQGVNNNLACYESLRKIPLDNGVPLPMHFTPRVPGVSLETGKKVFLPTKLPSVRKPANLEGVPFSWEAGRDFKKLRVGWAKSEFDAARQADYRRINEITFDTLRSLGLDLRMIALPESDLNFFFEYSERACGFDGFIRGRKDGGMKWKGHRTGRRTWHLAMPTMETTR